MKLCHFEAGLDRPLFLIAGPCAVESEAQTMAIAEANRPTRLGGTSASAATCEAPNQKPMPNTIAASANEPAAATGHHEGIVNRARWLSFAPAAAASARGTSSSCLT